MLSRQALKSFFVFLAVLVLLTPTIALAQAAQATVHGLIADPDDAVIPGATITLAPASGKATTTTSGSDGTYTVHVAPGTYNVTVTMQGFASYVRMGVRLTNGENLAID